MQTPARQTVPRRLCEGFDKLSLNGLWVESAGRCGPVTATASAPSRPAPRHRHRLIAASPTPTPTPPSPPPLHRPGLARCFAVAALGVGLQRLGRPHLAFFGRFQGGAAQVVLAKVGHQPLGGVLPVGSAAGGGCGGRGPTRCGLAAGKALPAERLRPRLRNRCTIGGFTRFLAASSGLTQIHAASRPAGCPRVFHSDTSTPPAIRPKVTLSEITAGILPMMPTRKILLPMNTSTRARAYLRYLKR